MSSLRVRDLYNHFQIKYQPSSEGHKVLGEVLAQLKAIAEHDYKSQQERLEAYCTMLFIEQDGEKAIEYGREALRLCRHQITAAPDAARQESLQRVQKMVVGRVERVKQERWEQVAGRTAGPEKELAGLLDALQVGEGDGVGEATKAMGDLSTED